MLLILNDLRLMHRPLLIYRIGFYLALSDLLNVVPKQKRYLPDKRNINSMGIKFYLRKELVWFRADPQLRLRECRNSPASFFRQRR